MAKLTKRQKSIKEFTALHSEKTNAAEALVALKKFVADSGSKNIIPSPFP